MAQPEVTLRLVSSCGQQGELLRHSGIFKETEPAAWDAYVCVCREGKHRWTETHRNTERSREREKDRGTETETERRYVGIGSRDCEGLISPDLMGEASRLGTQGRTAVWSHRQSAGKFLLLVFILFRSLAD